MIETEPKSIRTLTAFGGTDRLLKRMVFGHGRLAETI
jgi:hypothetical protein